MRALTVQQPWAWAIVHGGKDVENRTRNLAGSYRGPIAIHAGRARPEKHNLASVAHRAAHGTEVPPELVFGAFIGVVDLVHVHPCRMLDDGSGCCDPWGEQEYVDGPRRLGQPPELARRLPARVHLVLRDPRPLTQPIPCRGRLGLWAPPAAVLEQLQAVSS